MPDLFAMPGGDAAPQDAQHEWAVGMPFPKYDNAIVCSWPATCHVRDAEVQSLPPVPRTR